MPSYKRPKMLTNWPCVSNGAESKKISEAPSQKLLPRHIYGPEALWALLEGAAAAILYSQRETQALAYLNLTPAVLMTFEGAVLLVLGKILWEYCISVKQLQTQKSMDILMKVGLET